MRWIVTPGEEARLDAFTLDRISTALGRPLAKSAVRRLIMAGAVRVDGRPTRRPGLPLAAGARIEATVDEHRISRPEDAERVMPPIRVLYEDDALLAVAKPPFLATHASADPSRADLFSRIRRQLAERSGAPPGIVPYLGLHHRLDRDTSGVMLFTKLESANASVAAQFAGRSVEKVYHALTMRPPSLRNEPWTVEDELAQVGSGRGSRTSRVTSGGQRAVTSFAILERFRHALLVEARPHTGRKHQVRAHLAGCEMAIIGDDRYGGPTRVAGVAVARPLLHARRLALAHPLTAAPLEIECDYPQDFRDVLDRLRRLGGTPGTP